MSRAPSTATLEKTAFWLLAACLALVEFNLLTAQVVFGLASLAWLKVAIDDRRWPDVPRFFWPLATFAGLTLVSALFSGSPATSLVDSKQLVLFLIVPMALRLARADRAATALNLIIAVGAASALVGVVQSTMLGFDNLSNRPEGSLTHYMTYSGVIMLALSAAVAQLLFGRHPWAWPAIAIPALTVALALTLTRNAWIGALAAMVCLLALRRARLLLVIPVLVVVALVVAPASLRTRAASIFDRQDASNRDRLQMIAMGQRMIGDHPWFGVGPDTIKDVYPQYRPPDAVHPTNPHLHNVPVNIAAERGLPALAAWLWCIGIAVWDLVRQVRQGPAKAVAAAGLGALVAMLAAGLFEYNFGDSEFLMLLLGLMTLPYAARLPPRPVEP